MRRREAQVKEIRFHNPRLARVGVDVLNLDELRERAGVGLATPERPNFYMVLLVHAGRGSHMVDFVEYPLERGAVLLVRPGQVQQWHLHKGLHAELVLVSPEALAPFIDRADADMKMLSLDDWPPMLRPQANTFAQARSAVATLRADTRDFAGTAMESALTGMNCWPCSCAWPESALLAPGRSGPRTAEIHRLFLRETEKSLGRRVSVRELARRLGYSESTLTRSCLAVAGHTPKELMDQWIVLEAKRLLVHSQATVGQVSHMLGFSEPTNFVKFFRRFGEVSPSEFRASHLEL